MASQLLSRRSLPRLAYKQLPGREPGVVFLLGFEDTRANAKCQAVERFCQETGRAFLSFDYRGCGESEGCFQDSRLGDWKEDALAALDELTRGPQVLVAASMGGWLALLVALERPERVAGLVATGIGVDGFAFHARGLPEEVRSPARRSGLYAFPRPGGRHLPMQWAFFEEAERHCLLARPTLALACPVRLLHGLRDDVVPWQRAVQVAEKLQSGDVRVVLLKDGRHGLDREHELRELLAAVRGLLESLPREA